MKNVVYLLIFAAHASAGVMTLADPYSPLVDGETAVWSPLFQATWEAMNTELGGKPQKIEPPNELMARLDAFDWEPESVMPEIGWKVWSGEATPDFLKQVNTEAKVMRGGNEEPFTARAADSHSLACFGLLDRDVKFVKEFRQSLKNPLEFTVMNKVSRVAFFGTRGDLSASYGKEIQVLLSAKNWHALEISCEGSDDKVIVYLPPEPQKFDVACGIIRKARKALMKKGGSLLHAGDDVRIPYLSLNVTDDLTDQLQGERFHGNAGDPWRIIRAEQVTTFELFEKGAKVRVDTSTAAAPFGEPMPPPRPRRFIYNRPFFVFLWRKEAEWPYLGVWVGDITGLRKF